MNKADKIEISQNYIDGLNSLTIRFNAFKIVDGVKVPCKKGEKYPKKEGNYFTKSELKYMKKIHDEINNGMTLKLNEDENEVTDFDGAAKGKPDKVKAKEKMKEKYPDDEDIEDVVDIYFLTENKDKVGDKAKKVK